MITVTTLLLLSSVTAAGYYDLRFRRIPNWLVLVTVIGSLGWHTVEGGLSQLSASALGLFLGIAVMFPLYLLRSIGAGDAKLMGAVGAAVTYKSLFTILLVAILVAGVMAVFYILRARAIRSTASNFADLVGRFLRGRFSPHPVLNVANKQALAIPFGVSVAIATWMFVVLKAQ